MYACMYVWSSCSSESFSSIEQGNHGKIQDTRNYTLQGAGQDGQFEDCTKEVLEELCEDDYSDAEEELEANLDTD